MSRKKLARIKQSQKLLNITREPKKFKGVWADYFFGNSNPIVLELACGKGEYSLQLARMFPDKNFIGIDRKADRIWHGATKAIENNLTNVLFINDKIEFIAEFFAKNEVDGIWITFPDPFLKKPNKRLTADVFLERYAKVLQPDGIIHLKTDELKLHNFTLETLESANCDVLEKTSNLYSSALAKDPLLQVTTTYEKRHIAKGDNICYIKFKIRKDL